MSRQLLIAIAALFAGTSGVFAHGDLSEAIDVLSKVIATSPPDAGLFLRRAEFHRMHADWPAAEADYAAARRIEPQMDGVTFGRAQMRLAQGRERDGLKLLDEFLVKRPEHAEGRAIRAALLEKRGDWKKADSDLAAAVASSPEPHYATTRAGLLERHGRASTAARCLEEASRAHGRLPVIEQQALEIEARAGLIDSALRRVDDLIAREPRLDIWLAIEARLLEKAGRAPEVRAAWQSADTAFERVPEERRASEFNRKLVAEIEAGRAAALAKPQ